MKRTGTETICIRRMLRPYNGFGVTLMRRRALFLTGAAALAVLAVAGFQRTALDSFNSALAGAKGLDAEYTLTVVGGTTSQYKVSLAKPDKARIETPELLVVADGETITRLMKRDGIYFKKDQTQEELQSLMAMDGLSMWAPFFNENAAGRYSNVRDAGTRKRGQVDYKVVNATHGARGETQLTYYIDPSDSLAKQGQFVNNLSGRSVTTVMNASKAVLTVPGDDVFAFTAPSGAKEVKEIDLVAGKWLYDYEEAKKAAVVGNKLIMVDFMAEWCGPCKMMEAEVFSTSSFKEATKNMVLLKVDVDRQQGLAQKYGVTAMPTVKFINANGQIVHEFVGYGGFNHVMGEVQTASGKHR